MNHRITLGNVHLVRNFISFTFIGKLNDRMVLEFVQDDKGEPFYRIHQKPNYHFEHALEIAKEVILCFLIAKKKFGLFQMDF